MLFCFLHFVSKQFKEQITLILLIPDVWNPRIWCQMNDHVYFSVCSCLLKKKSWFVPKDTCLPCKFHQDPKWKMKTVSSKLVWKCRCHILKRRKAFHRKAAGEVWVQVDSKPNCSSHSYRNRLGPQLQQTGRIFICEPRIKSSHHREQDKISSYI